jgi:predicted dehydrogenase
MHTAGAAAVGSTVLAGPRRAAAGAAGPPATRRDRMRIALIGTGVRGSGMYGRRLVRQYGDYVELVGLCDSNPGRLRYAREFIGADCPAFEHVEEMLAATRPEKLIVTSWDWEHHNHIVAGMKHGCDIICEKPVTIDEEKAQAILDAQQRYGREVIVTHNYRYPPHRGKLKELLLEGRIGDITTVDFHWNITYPHLQQYMRRWHGHRDRGGTLWVHKSSHHFDMINWYLEAEPVEVFAYADLERYGAKGPFRGEKCRTCPHQAKCPAYWDITTSEHLVKLYVDNEHHDGYIRDNCVFRETIDIYDKHAAVVKYANNVYLNYSLTADTDNEGFWIAFNGTQGRIEGREINWPPDKYHHDWILNVHGREPEVIRTSFQEGGQPTSDHWGGDPLLLDKLFKNPGAPDPWHQAADLRDGIMAVLAGVAARKSVDAGGPVKIAGLTELEPRASRLAS